MPRVCIIVVSDVISVLKSLQYCLCQCDDKWDVFMDGQRIQMTMPLKNVSDEKMRNGNNCDNSASEYNSLINEQVRVSEVTMALHTGYLCSSDQ